MLAHCRTLGGCATGEAKITPGFSLPARWIIHTVGPVWRGGNAGEADLLAACYRNSCALAAEHRLATMAFPAISCGVYGYPPEAAAAIAVVQCRQALATHPDLERIDLVAFDPTMVRVLEKAMAES
ncbi:macro domain-containing protein [Nitrogeniibacter mangrovi]|uniref:macro domain-containing protein n=1 Tax=Nitrogeniibacter mangrovi TaxID=2016596 RepID=UPI002269CB32|nr:macro domain-containing protein [Nitrogeniibacter mangrovi]